MLGEQDMKAGTGRRPASNSVCSPDMQREEDALAGLRTISLKKLNTIKLMKRYDNKYTFHKDQLPVLWNFLKQRHQVLETAGNKIFTYDNLYFDTSDYFFYHQHHNQRANRYKLRYRKYLETDQVYFEVKFKNNKKKTIKERFLTEKDFLEKELPEAPKSFARSMVLANGGIFIDASILPALWVRFNRVTFADPVHKERITFDFNLSYTDLDNNSRAIDNLVIAEVKSETPSMNSPFSRFLRQQRIFPSTFSKYCMGVLLINPDVKYNRFKGRLSKLQNY